MDLLWLLVHAGSSFIETYVVINLFSAKYALKKSKGAKNFSIGIIVAIMVLKNITDVHFISENVFMIGIGVALFISSNILFEGKKIEHLLIIGLSVTAIAIIDYVTISILIKVLNVELSQILSHTSDRFLAIVISKVMDFIVFHMYLKIRMQNKIYMGNKYTLEYMIIVISNIICIFLINAYFKSAIKGPGEYILLQNILIMAIGITSIGVVFIYDRLIKQTRKQIAYELALQAGEYQENYKKNIEETAEILSRKNHDFHNHMMVVKELLEKNRTSEASDYMDDLLIDMENNTKNVVITHNAVIDAILTFKKDMAKKWGIDFTEKVNLEKLHIADVDMTVLLGNMLDNAIEASIKGSQEKRFIDLYISEEKGYLRIQCNNNFDGLIHKEEGKILTRKNDKENHGYGLKNIEMISNKYDGYIKKDIKEEEFSIIVYVKNIKLNLSDL